MARLLPACLPLLALAGCSLAPHYSRPAAPVPASWPVGDAYLRQSEAALPSVTYAQVFHDPRLQAVIARALGNSRDLRIAAANIVAARAQYRIQRAGLFPEIDANARYSRSGGGSGASNVASGTTGSGTNTTAGSGTTGPGGAGTATTGNGGTTSGTGTGTVVTTSGASSVYAANLSVTSFELDLFGRLRSLSTAALNRWFETEAGARATRLTLVGDVAQAWLTYASDRSLLLIAQQTATSAEESVRLTEARMLGGITPQTDVYQAQQILETARADIAQQNTLLAQDVNALQLLVGGTVDPAQLPKSID